MEKINLQDLKTEYNLFINSRLCKLKLSFLSMGFKHGQQLINKQMNNLYDVFKLII